MNKYLLGLALAAIGAASAVAADLPARTYTKAPVVAPAYSWTGFYVGANAGYGWQNDPTVSFSGNDSVATGFTCGGLFGGTCPLPTAYNIGGPLGGVQAGYNWQVNQKWLLGIEADIDAADINGTGTNPGFFVGNTPVTFQDSQRIDWFGTIRGRAGFLAMPNLLLFGTAGFAYGRVRENTALNSSLPTSGAISNNGVFVAFDCLAGPNCFVGSSSRMATGWTAGAGLEYAFWKNISLKAEYLYVNLGGGDGVNVVAVSTANVIGSPVSPASFTASHSRTDFQTVRLGFNVKLGNP
jgi:outer membrane immunogenic protein